MRNRRTKTLGGLACAVVLAAAAPASAESPCPVSQIGQPCAGGVTTCVQATCGKTQLDGAVASSVCGLCAYVSGVYCLPADVDKSCGDGGVCTFAGGSTSGGDGNGNTSSYGLQTCNPVVDAGPGSSSGTLGPSCPPEDDGKPCDGGGVCTIYGGSSGAGSSSGTGSSSSGGAGGSSSGGSTGGSSTGSANPVVASSVSMAACWFPGAGSSGGVVAGGSASSGSSSGGVSSGASGSSSGAASSSTGSSSSSGTSSSSGSSSSGTSSSGSGAGIRDASASSSGDIGSSGSGGSAGPGALDDAGSDAGPDPFDGRQEPGCSVAGSRPSRIFGWFAMIWVTALLWRRRTC